MGSMGCNQTPCGDLYQPPSKSNMSFFAIFELVIMIVVAVLCVVELIHFLGDGEDFSVIKFLVLIDDILVVLALGYIVYGLFCGITSGKIKLGILLFAVAAILAMVIIVLELNQSTKNVWYKIFQFCIYLFLAFILWQQAARIP